MKQFILLISISLIPFQLLFSQTTNVDSIEFAYPGEVVITAPRISLPLRRAPFSTSLVDSTALAVLPRAVAMDEALMLTPGVKVDNQANGERVHVSIRGQGILTETGIRSIKVLLDDIPMNDPTGFAPDFFDVDLNTVERIEVLRGPAASIYGGGAAGGIINIITQNSPNAPLSGEVSATGGSNGFWNGSGQFGGRMRNINYRASFSRAAGDGYRVHTHFWQNRIYAKATYTPGSSFQLVPIVSWSHTYHENPEGLSLSQYLQDPRLANDDAVPYNEHMEMNRTTEGVAGVAHLSENHELRFNAYMKESNYTEANNRVFDHQVLTTPGASVQYTFSSGVDEDLLRNQLSAGADLQWQTNDEHLNPNYNAIEGDTVLARQQIRQSGQGFFVIDVVTINRDWSLMGNLRFDKIRNELTDLMKTDSTDLSGSADFSNLTARLGVAFSPSPDMTLFTNWGQGFIPPSTEELGSNPTGYGGFNSSLTAATSSCFEAGARGVVAHEIRFGLTGFYMLTKNDFDRYRIPGRGHGQEGTFYRNVAASNRYGLELSTWYKPVEPLAIQLAYTYSHFKYDIGAPIQIMMDDTTIRKYIENGNWLPNSPMHQLAVDIRYDISPEVSLGLTSETLSESYIDGANIESEAAPGYTLLAARVIYHWHVMGIAGDIMFHARNIADTRYVAFTEPDPGGNSYQPGAGREFFANVKILL
jgi:iron complex outermembrane recepter protein